MCSRFKVCLQPWTLCVFCRLDPRCSKSGSRDCSGEEKGSSSPLCFLSCSIVTVWDVTAALIKRSLIIYSLFDRASGCTQPVAKVTLSSLWYGLNPQRAQLKEQGSKLLFKITEKCTRISFSCFICAPRRLVVLFYSHTINAIIQENFRLLKMWNLFIDSRLFHRCLVDRSVKNVVFRKCKEKLGNSWDTRPDRYKLLPNLLQKLKKILYMKLVIFTAINKDENAECTSRLVCEEHDSPVRSLSAASVMRLMTE